MRDELFIRGDVPMTKSEVRAVSLSKLELNSDSILYDVGAGTGSVSIEASPILKSGRVYAIEKKPEALDLIKANKEKFCAHCLEIVEGAAPEAFKALEAPTHVFIGGTSGSMEEILDLVLRKKPQSPDRHKCNRPGILNRGLILAEKPFHFRGNRTGADCKEQKAGRLSFDDRTESGVCGIFWRRRRRLP